MTALRRVTIAFLIATLVALLFSWPLARFANHGIPSSSSNVEKDNARAMIAGDHLQFLYHMWLAKDTFTGNTPLFYNLYEFNTGDDAERYEVRPYYLPFSLFFTLGALIGGQAFGWNFTILITFWLTYWFSWKLARRYHSDEWITATLAVLPIAFPFTWIVLLGGSPTGFAMMWVPILLYGIDRWIADKSFAGASLVGATLFFAEWSDTHVFFFNALLTPFWVLFVYLYHYGWRFPGKAEWVGWIKSSAVLILFVGLVAYKALSVQEGLQSTPIAAGRSLHEVSLFSHGLDGLITLRRDGDGRKIYVGIYGLILLAVALIAGIRKVWRDRTSPQGWCLLLLLAGIAAIFLLSTGVKNPFGPRAWQILMKVVPPYGMIRQPDKIFCILPALLLVAGALGFSWTLRRSNPWLVRIIVLAALIPLYIDYQSRLNPTICLLDPHQGAYQAVADDAAAQDATPRAMVIPLWPGNSHFSSLYEYYVSLYRIRMVNGYRPTPRQVYLDTIFEPFQSINSGHPSDEQLDDLLSRGVRHLILHEDAFPEKVSSFPVGVTLANLLRHPRLQILKQDGPVWSFTILQDPQPLQNDHLMHIPVSFPVRYWDWERGETPAELKIVDPSALGGKFLRFAATESFALTTQPVRIAGALPLEWHIRLRSIGTAHIEMIGTSFSFSTNIQVRSADWTWVSFPLPDKALNSEQRLSITVTDGDLDLDAALLTQAGWRELDIGDDLKIPAVSFFRAGYTMEDRQSVVFRTTHDPADQIFYSRNLYLAPGRYRISMHYQTQAPVGSVLGEMVMRSFWPDIPDTTMPVIAGDAAVMEYVQHDNRFFRFAFNYSRNADVSISAVTLERIP